MTSSGSVAGRALLAVVLMIGFYVLALAIVGFLLVLPAAELAYLGQLHPQIALACIVAAITIVWSIVPRWDRFPAPGPQLEPARHPKLFAEIDGVSRATGQPMPDEVFLVGDVNAWVAQRGGIMGLFSRRVMGLGLPLLQVLSVTELRAVVAHEFGHFYGGDTRLGPWVYKTRSAIARTVGGLRNSLLRAPFVWYGNMFLRVSHAVSRRQEFSADALASKVVGSRPLIEGLKKVKVATEAYDAYWTSEIAPVLQVGFLPPIADGFRRFTSEERVTKAMAGSLEKGLKVTKAAPYDTHPPLAERIAALSELPAGPDPSGEPPAISLLSDLPELERRWLAMVAGPSTVGKLSAVDWDGVMGKALLPAWRATVAANASALDGGTVGALGWVVLGRADRAERLRRAHGGNARISADFVLWLAAAAATLALDRAGWTIESLPGAPVTARRDGAEVRPFEVVNALAKGTMAEDAWRAEAERLGVGALPLNPSG